MRSELRATAHIAKYGRVESGRGPCLVGLECEPAQAVRRCVSIGKKTVGRASRTPV